MHDHPELPGPPFSNDFVSGRKARTRYRFSAFGYQPEGQKSGTPIVAKIKYTSGAGLIERTALVLSKSTLSRNCSHGLKCSYYFDVGPDGVADMICNWKGLSSVREIS